MNEEHKQRLIEIMKMAAKLDWVFPPQVIPFKEGERNSEYPLMICSEVEKCMLAMVDDAEFEQMKKWVEDKEKLEKI